jgi:hypothetical protein
MPRANEDAELRRTTYSPMARRRPDERHQRGLDQRGRSLTRRFGMPLWIAAQSAQQGPARAVSSKLSWELCLLAAATPLPDRPAAGRVLDGGR